MKAQCSTRSVLPGNPPTCPRCLCFPCSAPLRSAKVSGFALWMPGTPPAGGEHHRPCGMVTGHDSDPPANNDGRLALNVAGRTKVPAEPGLTAAEGNTWHGNAFQAMYAPITPHIMFMTQRDMNLGSQTTNRVFPCVMAQEAKRAHLIWNAMHIIKPRGTQPLS